MPDLDTSAAIRRSLEHVWGRLAEEIAETKLLERRVTEGWEEDATLRDRERWLSLFERELGSVQKVCDAVSRGVKIPDDQMLAADEAGKELLRILLSRVAPAVRRDDSAGHRRQPASAGAG